ncbi:MAG: hypothetical protein ERJ67_10595 [Aphanocapsa feldmannii 277cV]|uniref:Molecular chaperone DnaJ n=2 Tax=Aphanocapsa feldmannii TaxID=192050 RepID=A0A524RKU7_9CHRO|nr:MAG: hypothetical protein ERJ69_06310 [Aphanocapsa feldmannii 288cV]TGG90492.1 MAG: hypothetical protein ERJ67_10595 [Aphanocapsa feldmannii 277cV]TGH27566.1 MAG: hypothetical protein ERJ68_00935 [Aphanocapsa feldmannii 277cI]
MGQASEETDSPYARLGIGAEASFEAVQAARDHKLAACGDDPMAKARIEKAYDAVLQDRLKLRQSGQASMAAVEASKEEAKAGRPLKQVKLPTLPRLPAPNRSNAIAAPRIGSPGFKAPSLALAEGPQLWLPLVVLGGLLAWTLVAPPDPRNLSLLLALGTGATVFSLLKRSGRFFQSVFLGFAALALGLSLGGLASASLAPLLAGLTELQLSSGLALLTLLITALLLD